MALQQQRVFNKLILFQRNAELEETEEKGENEEVERDAITEITRHTHTHYVSTASFTEQSCLATGLL